MDIKVFFDELISLFGAVVLFPIFIFFMFPCKSIVKSSSTKPCSFFLIEILG